MDKEFAKYLVPVLIVSAILVGLIGMNVTTPMTANTVAANGATIQYHSSVCKQVVRADGKKENLGCSHNLFTNAGKNMTRDMLGQNTGLPLVLNINLANGSGAVGANAYLDGNITDCGLAAALGTYSINQTNVGSWFVAKTFTCACDNELVRATGLWNSTAMNNVAFYFAGNNFTNTTLQAQDQITITWSIWVT